MRREKLIEEIQNAAVANRMTCEKAHALATELKVSLKEIGDLCNELRIKITACQLGCF